MSVAIVGNLEASVEMIMYSVVTYEHGDESFGLDRGSSRLICLGY